MPPPRPWSPPGQPIRGSDLRAFGITARKLSGEVRRGTVVRLRQGVYVAASKVLTDPRQLHLMRAAAEQLVHPELVAGHETAALAWGLPLPDDGRSAAGPPTFLRPRTTDLRSVRGEHARIRLAHLPAHHVVNGEQGLRLTTRARTAVDVARGLTVPEALMVVSAALRAECLQMPFVSRRRDLANSRVHEAGLAPLREAASMHRSEALLEVLALADPRLETPIESLSRGHMHLAGLPTPTPQLQVVTASGSYYPDFVWPERRLIGEADGRVKYEGADDIMREKYREQALRDVGFEIVRWTGREIRLTPRLVMDRIGRALSR